MIQGKTTDIQFIYRSPGDKDRWLPNNRPEGRWDNRLGNEECGIRSAHCQHGIIAKAPVKQSRIGIKQKLSRIEAKTLFRRPGAVRTKTIPLTWFGGSTCCEVDIALTIHRHALFPFVMEQAEVNPAGIARAHGELCSANNGMRPQASAHFAPAVKLCPSRLLINSA